MGAPFFFEILAVVIGAAELRRALTGWVAPNDVEQSALRDSYYPGDVGFDPLGLKPDGAEDFAVMATKELQHGRHGWFGGTRASRRQGNSRPCRSGSGQLRPFVTAGSVLDDTLSLSQ